MQNDLFQQVDGGANPTSPLQFKIVELNVFDACEYNKKWHSRLPKIDWSNVVRNTHYVCYGASFNNWCYAVALWSSPVAQNRFKDGTSILELRRMAISNEAPKNTASRMISVMVKLIRNKFPDIKRLISYQDTDVHKGTIYKASGWKPASETEFISWTNKDRVRNKDQATGLKVRWEISIEDVNRH